MKLDFPIIMNPDNFAHGRTNGLPILEKFEVVQVAFETTLIESVQGVELNHHKVSIITLSSGKMAWVNMGKDELLDFMEGAEAERTKILMAYCDGDLEEQEPSSAVLPESNIILRDSSGFFKNTNPRQG